MALEAGEAYSHVGVAFMKKRADEDDGHEAKVWLSSMLSKAFEGTKRLEVRPCTEQI